MFRSAKNFRLIAVLILLLIVYGSVKIFKNSGRSKSFREHLVEIDTSKVSRIILQKPESQFEVLKSAEGWQVALPGNKMVEATSTSVKNALGTLMSIKPDRIATRDPEKWKDYQVDSAGTRIQVFEGDKSTLDMVIGRFGVHGRQQFHTFVRLEGDDEVYAANDFMGISFPSDPSSFRNTLVLELKTDSIQSITFNYPGDSSFILTKSLAGWNIGPQMADSASVANYIGKLRYVSNSNFVDDLEAGALINSLLKLDISFSNDDNITIEAYGHPSKGYIIHSSTNPESYFSDDALVDRLFIGASSLLN